MIVNKEDNRFLVSLREPVEEVFINKILIYNKKYKRKVFDCIGRRFGDDNITVLVKRK